MAVIVHLDRHDVTLCCLSQKLINKLKISYRPKVITSKSFSQCLQHCWLLVENGFFGCLPKKLRKKIWLYTFEPEFPFHGSIFDPIPAFTFDKSACNILYANHFIRKDVTNVSRRWALNFFQLTDIWDLEQSDEESLRFDEGKERLSSFSDEAQSLWLPQRRHSLPFSTWWNFQGRLIEHAPLPFQPRGAWGGAQEVSWGEVWGGAFKGIQAGFLCVGMELDRHIGRFLGRSSVDTPVRLDLLFQNWKPILICSPLKIVGGLRSYHLFIITSQSLWIFQESAKPNALFSLRHQSMQNQLI